MGESYLESFNLEFFLEFIDLDTDIERCRFSIE